MFDMIPQDFGVELIGESRDGKLYASAKYDIWHFLLAELSNNSEENWVVNNIYQQFFLRFRVAEAIESLQRFNEVAREGFYKVGDPVATDLSEKLNIYTRAPGVYDISMLQLENGFPDDLMSQVAEDINLLEVARQNVIFDGSVFVLADATTYKKNPVASKSPRLIQAIAFEREIRGDLRAEEFGIYSAFCTWRDFAFDGKMPRENLEVFIDEQFNYDARDYLGTSFLELALEVQEVLFGTYIWGIVDDIPVLVDKESAIKILEEGFNKLNSVQLAQVMLMNGMHDAGLFLSLAQVLNLNSWQNYMNWKTQGFQPNSEEEQSIRIETTFIKEFGELAADL